jgi:hypothetical protein
MMIANIADRLAKRVKIGDAFGGAARAKKLSIDGASGQRPRPRKHGSPVVIFASSERVEMPMAIRSWPEAPRGHWSASKLNGLAKRALALTMRAIGQAC